MEDIKNKLLENANNFDELISTNNLNIPYIGAISTAELFSYYGFIKDKWTLGSNTVNGLGEIIQRSYNELEFYTTEGKVEEIDLGFYDEEFEEHEYQGIGPDFIDWLHSVEEIYLEQYFNNEDPLVVTKTIEVPINTLEDNNVQEGNKVVENSNRFREKLIQQRIKKAEKEGKRYYEFDTDFTVGKAFGISFSCNTKFDLYQNKSPS